MQLVFSTGPRAIAAAAYGDRFKVPLAVGMLLANVLVVLSGWVAASPVPATTGVSLGPPAPVMISEASSALRKLREGSRVAQHGDGNKVEGEQHALERRSAAAGGTSAQPYPGTLPLVPLYGDSLLVHPAVVESNQVRLAPQKPQPADNGAIPAGDWRLFLSAQF
ncbi:hypothetical protein EX895_000394 [Sporisorium graminicola]|uniref:Uncharacterized protein n=1 Tax=Sporisorium graminicola TaxID=280036 RepID=A0A4U7L107_9BASI|nr:hypothetical protein EX895_000394 [Sporisorium graminicola]TKY90396.1 hypothetical protein EX895_000394 [Sporisorium graminicola]